MASPSGETILVAEDEAAVRSLTVDSLREDGFQVLEASDGDEALIVAEQHHDAIDALVTDAVMPNMNGRELFEQLERTRPGLKVLFVSGFANDAMIRDGKLPRGAAFLSKPFQHDKLARAVRHLLRDTKGKSPA